MISMSRFNRSAFRPVILAGAALAIALTAGCGGGGKNSDAAYVALYTGPDGEHPATRYAKGAPLNHVGVQVDDLDTIEMRVKAVGLTPFNHGDYEPGRRFYFFDPDGIEYEVVSYAEPRRR